jgi:hypothetical protein
MGVDFVLGATSMKHGKAFLISHLRLKMAASKQSQPPKIGTWNSGALNSKFDARLDLELPKIHYYGLPSRQKTR